MALVRLIFSIVTLNIGEFTADFLYVYAQLVY